MFVQFLIATMAIFVTGPLEIEGGKECVLNEGAKICLERAIEKREAVYNFND